MTDIISAEKLTTAASQNKWLSSIYKYSQIPDIVKIAHIIDPAFDGAFDSQKFASAVLKYQLQVLEFPPENLDGQFDPELIRKIAEKNGFNKDALNAKWKTILGQNYLGERWVDRREKTKEQIESFQSPMLSSKIVGDYTGAIPSDKKHTGGHWGIDLSAARGTPVYPIASGSVSSVGSNPKGGNAVKITHTGGYVSYYAHLNSIATKTGEAVTQDTIIGTCGNTGNAVGTSPHVHMEVWKDGQHINPISIFGKPVSPALSQAERKVVIHKIAAEMIEEISFSNAKDSFSTQFGKLPGISGIGRSVKDGKPVIYVLLNTAKLDPELKNSLPEEFEGFGIVYREVGDIKIQ